MTQDAEARMAVLIAIGLDDAPVVVAAHGVGLEAWHDSYIQYACAIVKADRNRLWWGSKHSKYGISLALDRKSTRLNSSHGYISYAVFCLKKKYKHFRAPEYATANGSLHFSARYCMRIIHTGNFKSNIGLRVVNRRQLHSVHNNCPYIYSV